jgi:hypothetical protein
MFLSSVAENSSKTKLPIVLGEKSLQSNFLSILFIPSGGDLLYLRHLHCNSLFTLPRVTTKKNTVLFWFGLVLLACKKHSVVYYLNGTKFKFFSVFWL